jgi:hypothetical protein
VEKTGQAVIREQLSWSNQARLEAVGQVPFSQDPAALAKMSENFGEADFAVPFWLG